MVLDYTEEKCLFAIAQKGKRSISVEVIGVDLIVKKEFRRSSKLFYSWGSENNGDNEAIEGESLSEDHHKNDSDQDVTVLDTLNASFAADSNGEAGGQAWKTDT